MYSRWVLTGLKDDRNYKTRRNIQILTTLEIASSGLPLGGRDGHLSLPFRGEVAPILLDISGFDEASQ